MGLAKGQRQLKKQRTGRFYINPSTIDGLVDSICQSLGLPDAQVDVTFVSARKMRQLNHTYRGKDKSTDVLSFPLYDWKKPLLVKNTARKPIKNTGLVLGDVVISLADAARNAADDQKELAEEVCFLLVHGILHLVGHDHMKKKEKEIMFKQQALLMRRLAAGARPQWWQCAKKYSGRRD